MKNKNFRSGGYFVRLYKSCVHSFSGLKFLLRNEKAFQQELVLFIVTIFMAVFYGLNNILIMVFVAILILVVESLNTAIESVCDEITLSYNQNVKIAKDVSSFAVMLLILLYSAIFCVTLFEALL